ncbi:hypothetical protein DXG01_017220 [Tephrocybe rancida]|nr:hypothetical protein DXG01_017220 [Tephrocybe rancida]
MLEPCHSIKESAVFQRKSVINWYTWRCALFATVGSLLYGIDSGVISTTISHPSFTAYFAPYTCTLSALVSYEVLNADPYFPADIAGAVVSTFFGGTFFGVLFAGWSADYWGRKRTIMFASICGIIAGAIQAGSINVGMLIAGRIVGGFTVGILRGYDNPCIPFRDSAPEQGMYTNRVSTAAIVSQVDVLQQRGLVSGLHGEFVGVGFAIANWVGYGCSFASGDFQWRFPLAIQCIPALVLLGGIWLLPYSPRWLLEQGRDDEAIVIVKKLTQGEGQHMDEVTSAEFIQMQQQIRYEKEHRMKTVREILASKSARKRLLLAVLIQVFTQLSGVNVINYQTNLYEGVGITGHTVTLIAGFYGQSFLDFHTDLLGMVGPTFNIICIAYVDKWGRKPTLWITSIAMAVDMALIMAFTANFSLGYNSIHFFYPPEIMSQNMRAKGTSVATKGKTLEEINALFGDKVVEVNLETDDEKREC